MSYVYDSNYNARLDVEMIRNEHDDALSCVITVDGGEGLDAVSIELGPDAVSEVRRALQRAERVFKTRSSA